MVVDLANTDPGEPALLLDPDYLIVSQHLLARRKEVSLYFLKFFFGPPSPRPYTYGSNMVPTIVPIEYGEGDKENKKELGLGFQLELKLKRPPVGAIYDWCYV